MKKSWMFFALVLVLPFSALADQDSKAPATGCSLNPKVQKSALSDSDQKKQKTLEEAQTARDSG